MADRCHIARKAGDIAAAGEKLAKPAQEDHHRQGDKDRVGAGIGDGNAG
jgi:hypothetical protein